MNFYAYNVPDNERNDKDHILLQYNTQLIDNQTAINLQTPTPLAFAQFGAQTINQSVQLLIQEPDLKIELIQSLYVADADDRVSVNITVSHTSISTSAAYDLRTSCVLPVWYHFIGGTMKVTTTTDWTKNITGPPEPLYLWGNFTGELNASLYIPYLGVGSTVMYSSDFLIDIHVPTDLDIVLPPTVERYFSAPNSTLTNRRYVYSHLLIYDYLMF